MLVTSMVPDAGGVGAIPKLLAAQAAGPPARPRRHPGHELRRRPRPGWGGRGAAGLRPRCPHPRPSPLALGPAALAVRGELAATWATKPWPWRVVCGAAGRAAARSGRGGRGVRRRRGRGQPGRGAALPTGVPVVLTEHEAIRAPASQWGRRASPSAVASSAGARLETLGGIPAVALGALRPAAGLLRGRRRRGAADGLPRPPQGSGSTPTG